MKYYENESRFNGSRDNLSNKIRDGAYLINLDEYSGIGTHWVALYLKNNDITYFDSVDVEHIPKEIKTFFKNRNIKTNIFRIQANDWIMCGYFCIAFIDFMLKGKSLTECTIFFHLMILRKMMIQFWIILWIIHKYKMESYCLKCKKHTKNINPQVSSTSNGKLMILSKCAICGSRKSKFIKKQDAKGILSSLGIKTPLSKIPLLGDVLF